LDCGSLLPLCGGRSLLRVGRSKGRPPRTQQAATATIAAASCRSPRPSAPRYALGVARGGSKCGFPRAPRQPEFAL